jgi:hypothetical protein
VQCAAAVSQHGARPGHHQQRTIEVRQRLSRLATGEQLGAERGERPVVVWLCGQGAPEAIERVVLEV